MSNKIIHHTTDITSAFLSHNHLKVEELPGFIAAVHGALAVLDKPTTIAAVKPKPAVALPWKKTIKPDHLISLVDGKPYKTLRRHLTRHDLTPEEYRERYQLPADYPMVAAAYSEKRSALAKAAGLGQQRQEQKTVAAPSKPAEEPRAEAAPAAEATLSDTVTATPKRGRPKKDAKAA